MRMVLKTHFFRPHAVERELAPTDQPKVYGRRLYGELLRLRKLARVLEVGHPKPSTRYWMTPSISFLPIIRHLWQKPLQKRGMLPSLNPSGVDFPALFYYLDNDTRGSISRRTHPFHQRHSLSISLAICRPITPWTLWLAAVFSLAKKCHDSPLSPFRGRHEYFQAKQDLFNSMPFFKHVLRPKSFCQLGLRYNGHK